MMVAYKGYMGLLERLKSYPDINDYQAALFIITSAS